LREILGLDVVSWNREAVVKGPVYPYGPFIRYSDAIRQSGICKRSIVLATPEDMHWNFTGYYSIDLWLSHNGIGLSEPDQFLAIPAVGIVMSRSASDTDIREYEGFAIPFGVNKRRNGTRQYKAYAIEKTENCEACGGPDRRRSEPP